MKKNHIDDLKANLGVLSALTNFLVIFYLTVAFRYLLYYFFFNFFNSFSVIRGFLFGLDVRKASRDLMHFLTFFGTKLSLS